MNVLKKNLFVLYIVLTFLLASCRSVFEIIGLADSQFVYQTKDGYPCRRLFVQKEKFFVSIGFPSSNTIHYDKNPKYYLGYVSMENQSGLRDDYIITQCENRISNNQKLNHKKIIYLFDKGHKDYWDKLPQNVDGPIYATVDDTTGYREYSSLELIPTRFRKNDERGELAIDLIYYGLLNELNDIQFYIELEFEQSGKMFRADTTFDLHKKYYEYPLFVH